MSQFTIKRDVTKLTITAQTGIGWTFGFNHNCSDEAYAILLRNEIQGRMDAEVSRIRREAYNLGWKDKSRKVRKATNFGGNPDHLSVWS